MKLFQNWLFSITLFLTLCFPIYSQKGKNGNYTTSALNQVVNTYTYLSSNASAGSTTLNVNNNTMTGGVFSGALSQGDLLLIIQIQGASMDIDVTPTAGWGGHYTVPAEFMTNGMNWHIIADKWGAVTNLNNCGLFETAEVQNVSGTTSITLQCPLQNNYTSSGHVLVVRIPRFQDLTVNNGTSIVCPQWNGNTGGIVALEVAGNCVINGTGKISSSSLGFRGGVADNTGGASSSVSTGNAAAGTGNGDTFLASDQGINGARKGEGIGGYTAEYTALFSVYGRSAPANGGGGAGYSNSGGGGGSNVGLGTYTGKGVPNPTYNTAWNLEKAGFGGSSSSGGGRGGYTLSSADANELTVGPNNNAWGSGYRKVEGGLGGHPLTYSNNRIFIGGGGGAGDQDNTQGGAGGNGGGIVFMTIYGSISGNGTIEANGGDGQKSNPTNQAPGFGQRKGNDGAGGAGGGGSVYIQNTNAIPGTLNITAKGGKGGDNALTLGTGATNIEANGPGGGGAGGAIAFTSGTPIQNVSGGANGIATVSPGTSTVQNFPPNGATSGASGMSSLATTIYDITAVNDTICENETATLSVNVVGSLPAGATIYWYTQQYGGTSIGSGTSYTTPVLTATTTYYAGVCPGTFRIPVKAVVNPKPIISGTPTIVNVSCTTQGSISGLTVTNGTPTYTYLWNPSAANTLNLSNAIAGSYTLTVTDSKGCTATSGPHGISNIAGPTINSSSIVLTNANCNNTNGSITGITATGNGLVYSWSNGGGNTINASNLASGSYTLTVTDNAGCVATSGPHTLTMLAGPTVNTGGVTITSASCGMNNGSITGITANGTGLTYNWNNGFANTIDVSNLGAGSYSLVVTDGNGCVANAGPFSVSSTGGALISTTNLIKSDDYCSQNIGSISGIQISGGALPYSYSWTNSTQTTLNLNNLGAASYVLTVTDGSGCNTISNPILINNISGPIISQASINILSENCNLGNGSISGLTVSGGTPNYTYSWNPSSTTSLNLSNVTAGSYTLTVTDSKGCTATSGPHVISNIAGPTINSSGIVLTNANCNNTNGSITGITATGNGLVYSWSNGGGNTINAANLSSGSYTLTVTDNAGCVATSGPHTLTMLAGPTVNTGGETITSASCGMNNGSITGITANGTGLTYNWNNGFANTIDISNLGAGSYSLVVTDGNGCVANAGPFSVSSTGGATIDVSNISLNDDHCSQSMGSINGIVVTGGNNPYTYSWTNTTQTTLALTNLNANNYVLTVTDGSGCITVSSPITINDISGPTISENSVVVSNGSCSTNSGSISGLVGTGTGLVYSWSNGGGNQLNASNLSTGDYALTLTDAFGCSITSSTFSITNSLGPTLDATGINIQDATCGLNNGSITGITANGTGLTYNWNNGFATTVDINNLAAGTYNLVISDLNGCTITSGPHIVNSNGNLTLDETNIVVLDEHCNKSDGSISGLIVNGGTAPYTYNWSNSSQTILDINNLSANSYQLTVTDAVGCTVTSQINVVNNLNGPSINTNTISIINEGCNLNDGQISGVTANGTGLTYLWSNGNTDLNINNITAGNYILTVTDAFGCTSNVGPFTVGGVVPLSIDTSNLILIASDCDYNNGSISGINVVGGVNPHFSWNNGATNLNIFQLAPGQHTLTVSDDQGCSKQYTFNVQVKSPPTIDVASLVISNAHCGKQNGSITGISVSGGTPDYQFKWNGNNSLNTLELSNISVGNYLLDVVDNAGCETSKTFVVSEDSGPVIDYSTANIIHQNCDTLGSISALSIIGNGPFNYIWSNGKNTLDIDELKGGDYTLVVIDAFGCKMTSNVFTINENKSPIADFYWAPNNPTIGEPFDLVNTSLYADAYHWSMDDGTFSNQENLKHTFNNQDDLSHSITLTAYSQNGCIDSVTYHIIMKEEIIFYVPNTFTPNGDEYNNTFKPIITSGIDLESYQIVIFNRWGETVFESRDTNFGWDGTYNNQILHDGAYTWKIYFKLNQTDEKKEVLGTLMLLK